MELFNDKKTLSKETVSMVNALECVLRARSEILTSLSYGVGEDKAEAVFLEKYAENIQPLIASIKEGIGNSMEDKMFYFDNQEL